VLFSWLIGATVADERFPFEVSVVVSYFTIVLFVVLSGPFWLARWVSKKRIAKPLAAAEGVREQFTVRHILIWTAVVAGIVSLGRLILGSQAQQNDMPPIGILFMFARFVAIIGLLVAAVGLPMVWAVLTERPSRRVWHLILGICCVAPLVVHELLWLGYCWPSAVNRRSCIWTHGLVRLCRCRCTHDRRRLDARTRSRISTIADSTSRWREC
jgi:hypothetical protein